MDEKTKVQQNEGKTAPKQRWSRLWKEQLECKQLVYTNEDDGYTQEWLMKASSKAVAAWVCRINTCFRKVINEITHKDSVKGQDVTTKSRD